ncbi:hypothetical protein ACFQVD_40020 [Streptosporangium amethystogenes subsp. fukuiense]|uniref:WXG100 family type VII secretion target n=1 Tax=Streptosporangium amethystogenes subsp. fukuiense TaxID=698418 RepID=A0ABW2TFC8_9ACTN
MVVRETPIKTEISTSEAVITLDLLKDAFDKVKPELIQSAAGEFRSVMANLKTLIACLDRHLDSFDKKWTAGEDAKMVKAQLRRLRESAQSVVDAIVTPNPPGKTGPFPPKGIAPALEMYSSTLKAFRGDQPDSVDRDVSFLEGAAQGGTIGLTGGAIFGGVPGAVIGGVSGAVVGGVTTLFTDGPFQNLFGDSKEEQELKAAKKYLKKLTAATAQNNEAFPDSVRTDTPEFSMPNPYLPPGALPVGTYPPGGGAGQVPGGVPAYDLTAGNDFTVPGSGLDGLNGDGFGVPGVNAPVWNGSGANGPGWNVPGLNGTDLNGTGLNGTGVNGGYPDGSGTNGTGKDGGSSGDPGNDTRLAGYNSHVPDFAGQQSSPGSGSGYSASVGGGVGYGGIGAGGDFRGAGTARALSAGTGSMMPLVPHSGAGREDDEERERSTWLLEDEDLFMSDRPVTSPFINGAPKGKA